MMAVSDKTETELLSRLAEGAPSDSAYKKFYVTGECGKKPRMVSFYILTILQILWMYLATITA